jgi:hypothetical protein
MAMGDAEKLSNSELKNLIIEHLEDLGIEHEMVDVEVRKGPKIVLRGEVYSERDRKTIVRMIKEDIGIGQIVDGIIVLREEYGEREDAGEAEEEDIYEQGEEYVGTEDIFRSMEDGIPYIPPSDPSYHRSYEELRWKRGKKKRR